MTRNELKAMADNVRDFHVKTRGKALMSAPAYMVLGLMETEEYTNNYCGALREALDAFPEVNRDDLETELDRFI